MIETLSFPKQRLSYKKKVRDNNKWAKNMIDHLLMNYTVDTGDGTFSGSNTHRKRMLTNYKLFNNQIDQKDFERELNPLGIEVGQFKDNIEPYNKAYNKIQVLLGEELKRPLNFRTVLVNSDGIKSKQMHKDMMLRQFIEADIQATIQQLQTGEEVDQSLFEGIVPPEELQKYMSTTYLEAREHKANQILKYMIKSLSVKELMNDAFKHALISGIECMWVGVENGEPTVQVLNPLGVFWHKSPEVKYIQDGLYAGYRTFMTAGDILDKFGQYLDDKDLKKFENSVQGIHGMRDDLVGKQMKYPNTTVYDTYMNTYYNANHDEGSYGRSKGEDWLVAHVEWMSQKRVGFVTYKDEDGLPKDTIVGEDFVVPPHAKRTTKKGEFGKKETVWEFDGITLKWGWIPEPWTGIRIGEDIYCCMGPKKYVKRSMDNPFDVQLGYYGLTLNNMNADSVSLMDRMRPFQYLYFIIMHKLKKLIARDRGKLFHFDTSMVDPKIGLEKTMYYLEEMDIDFFNPLHNAEQAGSAQRAKVTTATDRSNMQHILNYINLLVALDEQISDVAGVTRQREGQIQPSEAVTNSQQTIMQSSTITEAAYFFPHFKVWERVLNALVNVTQSCWKNKSILKQFVLDDLSIQALKLSPDELKNADFGVFISNSSRDNEVFENLRGLAQPLLQNDKAKFTDIIRLLKSESIGELESQIEQSEKSSIQQQMQEIQAQQEAQREATQAQVQLQQAEWEHEKDLQAQKDNAAMEREIIKATS